MSSLQQHEGHPIGAIIIIKRHLLLADSCSTSPSGIRRVEASEGSGIERAKVGHWSGQLGGRTWAEGVVDGGATFFFSLPATNPGLIARMRLGCLKELLVGL